MSFFGFDTALPRDRAASPPQLDDEPDDALDAKIRGLALGAREDVEIYTWGGDGYDGLGDLLDEGGDELNDDTFGVADVGAWRGVLPACPVELTLGDGRPRL
jgi:DNA topoisomerase 2-associated protein PAT1